MTQTGHGALAPIIEPPFTPVVDESFQLPWQEDKTDDC
jgi:hypothetical protein